MKLDVSDSVALQTRFWSTLLELLDIYRLCWLSAQSSAAIESWSCRFFGYLAALIVSPCLHFQQTTLPKRQLTVLIGIQCLDKLSLVDSAS